MSQINSSSERKPNYLLWGMWGIAAAALAVVVTILFAVISQTAQGQSATQALNSLFLLDSAQVTWYVTRSAGFIAYLLLWFSTAWGLAVSSKIFDRLLHRTFTFDFHEFISLLSIGFLILHIVVLTGDKYMPYTVAQILVPFISPYRPVWVGVGVIATYLMLLVTITFYIRSRITMKAFRVIHYTSFLAFLGGAVHGLFSGTDSPLAMTQLMYAGTLLVVVFLTVYWLLTLRTIQPSVAKQQSATGLPSKPQTGSYIRPISASTSRSTKPTVVDR